MIFAAGHPLLGAEPATPDFKEVYDLIHEHLKGVSDAELDRAAVDGLLKAFWPKVSLVTNETAAGGTSETPLVSKETIYENNLGYVRVARVGEGLAAQVDNAFQRLNATNKLAGVVLDLRYCDGADYGAAADTADLFLDKVQPLLNWGNGVVSSHENTNAIQVPVAVLVNHETSRAAEALAAVLRESGVGLILGGTTAGDALAMQDYPLKGGGKLEIATSPVLLGDGSEISRKGVKPDIQVTVSAADERAFFNNAFLQLPKTNLTAGAGGGLLGATNRVQHVRISEAELVREHKLGINPDSDFDLPVAKPGPPVVSDPTLARALDLLKGLAVVRREHR